MKFLITGGNGMLAYALKNKLQALHNAEIYACDKDVCDITDESSVKKIFDEFKPDVVLNCAAYTAVDKAEEEIDIALNINAHGVQNLAKAALENKVLLIHYSTDYVFDGSKESYNEDDLRDPINAYGLSKAKGEEEIENILGENKGKYYIIRTAWLYGPGGPNFVETMLRLSKEKDSISVVNDQHGSPTFTIDLAEATIKLLEDTGGKYPFGIYHLTNNDDCTWYEYTCKIFEYSSILTPVHPIDSSEFPRPAKRPKYSILKNNKGPLLRSWQEAVKDYLENYR
ncbi:MAG: dTDP-4-dehydrorhamnose reductase [Candidatus Peregrinibacteria bacterium]|nr:dTDP-4-dehydrorhamnose reductase [Candidatus Peregrinibacteria bacterium]MDZ4244754.1 dTDP-4-dehydrorhamnose reductase [Candidatus Gracilibacteria bacterium]